MTRFVIDEHDEMREVDRLLLEQMYTAATKRAGQIISISVRGAVEINPYFDEIQKDLTVVMSLFGTRNTAPARLVILTTVPSMMRRF